MLSPLQALLMLFPLPALLFSLQALLFLLQVVSKATTTIHIVPSTLIRYSSFTTLTGKQNSEGIYRNKIAPLVRSSIHCYQLRKKGGIEAICHSESGRDTWSSRLFNPLTQRYRLAEYINGGGKNKDDSDGNNNKDNSLSNIEVSKKA